MLEWLQSIDQQIFLFLNDLHSSFFDDVMFWISGNYSWWPLYLLLLIGVIFQSRWQSWLPVMIIILLITFTDQTSVHLFKNVIQRLRPCHHPEIGDMVHIVNEHCGGLYGFISSHASNTFAAAAFFSYYYKTRWIAVVLIIWASVVSYSRIYLGVHYPGDVLGGALWGAAAGYAFYQIYSIVKQKLAGPIRTATQG